MIRVTPTVSSWSRPSTCREDLKKRHTFIEERLKGHGNEADFPKFLHKLVRHRSIILHFELFRFWLRICGDIQYSKNNSPRRRFSDSASLGVAKSPTWRVGESLTLRLGEWGSRQLPDSANRRVGYRTNLSLFSSSFKTKFQSESTKIGFLM